MNLNDVFFGVSIFIITLLVLSGLFKIIDMKKDKKTANMFTEYMKKRERDGKDW